MANISQGNQPLPKKEANLLRQVVKNYESKQYVKGIKTAELILKKFPEHGETMAMKGLILNCLGRKKEAYDFVNRGLKSDVKSHICWHVYGLLYRSDRDYKKAISCYLNALKHDKENSQILRDLALLQIQMRDLNGFLETRHRLLQQRPNNRNNWISFSIAHYLNKNLEVAIQVLEAYEDTLEHVPKEEEYEHSEMLLFKIKMLDENGKKTEALALLENSKKIIKDKLEWLNVKGRLLLDINKLTEAYEIYKKLININSENYDYHKGFLKTLGIEKKENNDEDELKRLSEIYEELQMEHPQSRCCKRLPLDFKKGDNFVKAAEMYIVEYIVKGIPSLFSDLKPLYKNDDKSKSLELLFETYLQELITNSHSHSNSSNSKLNLECLEKIKSSPQSIVWILHYLAQHYDILSNDFDKALKLNTQAIDHTPTIAELYLARSKILKHTGDLIGSYMAANTARKLDMADRYLNCIAVKAAFRISLIKRAEYLAALFTKNGNEIENLVEMQCTWFEIVSGDAYRRNGNYGKALKQYLAVLNHYEDFVEDQFDFHGYCIRKMTLRSYIDMLDMENKIYKEKAYIKAACGAIKCYLELYDNKDLIHVTEETKDLKIDDNDIKFDIKPISKSNTSSSSEEVKKTEPFKKKKKQMDKDNVMNQSSSEITVDPDPEGKKLLECDALLEADKYVKMLRKHASDQFKSQQLGFEVYMRKNKLLLALSCVKRGLELNGHGDPEVHQMIITFTKKVEEEGIVISNGEVMQQNDTLVAEQDNVCHEILKEEIQVLLNGMTIENYNENYFEISKDHSYVCYAIFIQMKVFLNPNEKSNIIEEFSNNEFINLFEKMNLKEAIKIHEILNSKIINDRDLAEKWKLRCSKKFIYSTYFEGEHRTLFNYDQHGNIIIN